MGGEYVDEVYGEIAGHVDAVADLPPRLEPGGIVFLDSDPSEYLQGYWKGYEKGQSARRKILKAVPENETASHIAAYIENYEGIDIQLYTENSWLKAAARARAAIKKTSPSILT